MIKAIIFDWGGVIAPNSRSGWLNVLAHILNTTVENLLPHWRAAGYTDFSKGIIDEATFWRQFEISYGQPLSNDVAKIWIEGSALHPWPEMLSFVEELKDKGIRVALLSNTVKPMSVLARRAELYEKFNPVILSDEVGLVKPNLAIYRSVLKDLQLFATECIYVDDLPKNLEPAAAMGMVTILSSNNPSHTIANIKLALGI